MVVQWYFLNFVPGLLALYPMLWPGGAPSEVLVNHFTDDLSLLSREILITE